MRNQAMEMLSEESRLSQIVKLVGPDALPDEQRLILETARLLREGFLQQNAMDAVDAYSTVQKQIRMLDLILHFHERAQRIVKRGAPISVHPQPAGGRHADPHEDADRQRRAGADWMTFRKRSTSR